MPEREKITMLLERTPKLFVLNGEYEAAADFLIDNGVAAVVRCKDCKYYYVGDGWNACDAAGGLHEPEPLDYCSLGERK